MSFNDVDNNKPGVIKNPEVCDHICELLGIKDKDLFKKCILNSKSVAGKETMWKCNSIKKATDNKDALSK